MGFHAPERIDYLIKRQNIRNEIKRIQTPALIQAMIWLCAKDSSYLDGHWTKCRSQL